MKVGILGTGSYAPEKILTNDDLAKIVDTNDEWISTRTGIKERRIASADEATSDLAYRAALNAIDNAGIDKNEIEPYKKKHSDKIHIGDNVKIILTKI